MPDSGFLQVFDLELTTKSPLFVGNGAKIIKKNYLFNPRTSMVTVFDENKFFQMLIDHQLEDEYEQFIMGPMSNLYQFLTQTCCLREKDWKDAIRYCVSAEETLDEEHSLKDISTFIRDAYGRAYLPGSSVKGALRTILLNQMILNDSGARNFDKTRFDKNLENKYLNTLNLHVKNPQDAVNSIMRGIQISDSQPISDRAMMLSLKKDAHVDGEFSAGRGVVCRESIRPETQIHMKITLDQSILKGQITRESIAAAIREYDAYYEAMYLARFDEPRGAKACDFENCLVIGGGAGFFSKTLVYPFLGYEEGLKKTADMMQRKFRSHHHERDVSQGISPHTMEYTKYRAEYYLMGLCEVKIQ